MHASWTRCRRSPLRREGLATLALRTLNRQPSGVHASRASQTRGGALVSPWHRERGVGVGSPCGVVARDGARAPAALPVWTGRAVSPCAPTPSRACLCGQASRRPSGGGVQAGESRVGVGAASPHAAPPETARRLTPRVAIRRMIHASQCKRKASSAACNEGWMRIATSAVWKKACCTASGQERLGATLRSPPRCCPSI